MGRTPIIIGGICYVCTTIATFKEAQEAARRHTSLSSFSCATLMQTDEQKSSLLHYTARYRYHTATKWLLEKGLSPNYRNTHGLTPFHIALYFDDIVTAHFMLKHGASANMCDPSGDPPAHCLIQTHKLQLLELLLQHRPSSVDALRKEPHTLSYEYPLHRAISLNDYQAVKLLMRYQANTDIFDASRRTFLHYALECCHGNIALDFVPLTPLRTRDGLGYLPIHRAAQSGCTAALKKILELDPESVNSATRTDGNTPLHLAHNGATVAMLIAYKAHMWQYNYMHLTPLIDHIRYYMHLENHSHQEERRAEQPIKSLVYYGAIRFIPDCILISSICQNAETSDLTPSRRNTVRMLQGAINVYPLFCRIMPSHDEISYAHMPYYASIPLPTYDEGDENDHDNAKEKQIVLAHHGLYHTQERCEALRDTKDHPNYNPSELITRFTNYTQHMSQLKPYVHNAHNIIMTRAISQHEQAETLEKFQKSGYFCDINIFIPIEYGKENHDAYTHNMHLHSSRY